MHRGRSDALLQLAENLAEDLLHVPWTGHGWHDYSTAAIISKMVKMDLHEIFPGWVKGDYSAAKLD